MLLWCDGFDHYGIIDNLLDGPYAEIDRDASEWSLQTTQKRTGTHAMRMQDSAGTDIMRRVFGAPKVTAGFGAAVYFPDLPSSNDRVALAAFRDAANDPQVTFYLDTTGAISCRRGGPTGTLLGTSTGTLLTADSWNHVEFKVTIDNSYGAAEARLNGVTILDLNGVDTQATANVETSQIAWGNIPNGGLGPSVAEWFIDDIFAWDDSGSNVNDFVGDRRVALILPVADTAQTDFTKGGTDSPLPTNDYECIAEATPDDDATYIEGAPPAGSPIVEPVSEFQMDALPSNVSSITAIVSFGRMFKTDAGDCNIMMSLVSDAVGSPPAPAVADGEDRPITQAYTYWQDVFEVDPATGAPWTKDAAEAALFRFTRTL